MQLVKNRNKIKNKSAPNKESNKLRTKKGAKYVTTEYWKEE